MLEWIVFTISFLYRFLIKVAKLTGLLLHNYDFDVSVEFLGKKNNFFFFFINLKF